jgi:hypothetical protein
MFQRYFCYHKSLPTEYRDEIDNRGSVSALSAGAYTKTSYVMVNIVKRHGQLDMHPPPASLGKFFHHDGMYARKRPLPLCVYSVCTPESGRCHSVYSMRTPESGSCHSVYSVCTPESGRCHSVCTPESGRYHSVYSVCTPESGRCHSVCTLCEPTHKYSIGAAAKGHLVIGTSCSARRRRREHSPKIKWPNHLTQKT